MRSKRFTVLADEMREEYEETRLGWLKKYTPADNHEARLFDRLILNDWMLKRANRRLLDAEAALVGEEDTCHPASWSAKQEHKIELMLRYKDHAGAGFLPVVECPRGVAERSFARRSGSDAAVGKARRED